MLWEDFINVSMEFLENLSLFNANVSTSCLLMAILDYVKILLYATQLQDSPPCQSHKLVVFLPKSHLTQPSVAQPPTLPTKGLNMFIPQTPLSTLHIPRSPIQPISASALTTANTYKPSLSALSLIRRHDPLSIWATTINFKQFVSKCRPVFWF